MLRAMIVDDEAPARSELRFLLEQTGKIGTIIRTAEAIGVKGLLLSESCCDIYNP